jgi:SAM-dependent methyltransferase
LSCAPHIADGTFDCIILTQTLHYIFDLKAALATLYRILKPGGVVLATLPGISQVCRDQQDKESDCWRFTDGSARRLFSDSFGATQVHVETHGNVLAATAFLYGLCVQDLKVTELDHRDRDYLLTITVVATKQKEAG